MKHFVILTLIALTSPAMSGELQFSRPPERNWSAVAFNEDGSRGEATDELSEANARSTAYTRCNGACKFVVAYPRGYCIAVAAYGRGSYGYVNDCSRLSSTDAEREALLGCRNRGIPACRIVYSRCS